MRHKADLRGYQNRIIQHLYEHDEALCVVRPGGGKTASALTAITEMIEDGVIRHALIIAPKRVAQAVWPDEIGLWSHTNHLHYAVLRGSPRQRMELLREHACRDITIIGIDLVGWLLEALEDNCHPSDPIYDLLVIDEVSRFRNPTGVRAKALAKKAGRWKMIWGLTGTLRPSGAEDLFMPARIVTRGGLWGKSFYKWRMEHFRPIDYNAYQWAPLPGAEEQLNAKIAPLIVTLNEGELPQLPGLSIMFDRVELPPEARRIYDQMHDRLAVGETVAANTAVATGKLAQIANGFLYSGDNKVPMPVHDEKRQWLADLVTDAVGPVLLVYEFIEDLELMREVISPKLPYLGQGVSDMQAGQNILLWNRGLLPFMAMHPASGGHGLNLQDGGSDMAWLSPTWSPEYWEQAIARLHRSGQTKPVFVRVCVAAGTVDQMKIDRVHHKMEKQEAFEKYLRDQQLRAMLLA